MSKLEDEDGIDGPFEKAITADIREAARALGRKGGQSRSEAKLRAVRENGKKGGRPPKSPKPPDPPQKP